MQQDGTTGQKLRALIERSGVTYRPLAEAMGYSAASGIQRYVEPHFDKPLALNVAKKFIKGLEGKGSPPITADEIMALTAIGDMPGLNGTPVSFEGAAMARMPQDLPIYGTALGADKIVDDHAVEQTYLNSGEIIGYAKRPPILDGKADAYGMYVQGASMSPVYEDGALVLVDTKRPPRVGDDVVVYLRSTGEEDMDDSHGRSRSVLVKRLVRRSASYVELQQFGPAMTFKLDAKDVHFMHRVMTLSDLLS